MKKGCNNRPYKLVPARSKKLVLEFGWYGQPADVAWAERLLPELLSADKATK